MKRRMHLSKCATVLPLILCASGLAAGEPNYWPGGQCTNNLLKGRYVFTASGFTRPPGSAPGTPWVPKAIVEVLDFDGAGAVTTPAVTVANPFGDLGTILQPPGGAPGVYTVNEDCSGTLQFGDASSVAFRIYVEPRRGSTIWLIQTNPTNNVFQGSATRVRRGLPGMPAG